MGSKQFPKIISGIQSLIKKITSVTGILGFFIESVKNVVMGIGTVIRETLSNILKFDFLKDKKDIEEGIDKSHYGFDEFSKRIDSRRTSISKGRSIWNTRTTWLLISVKKKKNNNLEERV